MGREPPVPCESSDRHSKVRPKREENAQVKDPFGREKALQEDWHRQNRPWPDQDAPHAFIQIAKIEAQARQVRARLRRRLFESSAHDSLRLISYAWIPPF